MELLSQKIINNFAQQYIDELKNNLIRKDKVASGNLVRSLDYRVGKVMGELNIEIIANEYLQWVDQGRRKGKYPPIQAIANWARIRGISKEAVFPIARNIFKFGIKPTRVIQTTDRRMAQKVDSALGREIANNIENFVGYSWTNIVFDRKGQPWDANSPQGKFIMNMRGPWDIEI